MNWPVAAFIFAMAVAAGAVLYLPFFLWFRWRRPKAQSGAMGSLRLTGAGLCFCAAVSLVLFAGLAAGQLAPASWLGAQVRTVFGGLGYAVVVIAVASTLERALLKRGVFLSHREPPLPNPEAPARHASGPEGAEAGQGPADRHS